VTIAAGKLLGETRGRDALAPVFFPELAPSPTLRRCRRARRLAYLNSGAAKSLVAFRMSKFSIAVAVSTRFASILSEGRLNRGFRSQEDAKVLAWGLL